MKIEKLRTFLKDGKAEFLGECADCSTKVRVHVSEKAGELFISGGAVYDFHKVLFFKCDECYEKNPVLENFNPCEVYSRVVGYLRPVAQWNPGKQAEFAQRKPFSLEKNMKVLVGDEERILPYIPFFRVGKEIEIAGKIFECIGIETRKGEVLFVLKEKV
jgi:hypothetical protein